MRKVMNYEKCVVEIKFKHLVPVKQQHSVFFHGMEYPVSFKDNKLGLGGHG